MINPKSNDVLFQQYWSESDIYKKNQIRNQIVLNNLGLVAHFARKYNWNTVDYEDILQDGIVGLIYAIERYNPKYGSFSNYARYWIKQKIWQNTLKEYFKNRDKTAVSLNEPIDGNELNEIELIDIIADENSQIPFDIVDNKTAIKNMLDSKKLTDTERQFVKEYLKDKNFAKTSKRLGFTPQNAQNILQKMAKKFSA